MKPGKDTTQDIPTISGQAKFTVGEAATPSKAFDPDRDECGEGCNCEGTAKAEDQMWAKISKEIDSQ